MIASRTRQQRIPYRVVLGRPPHREPPKPNRDHTKPGDVDGKKNPLGKTEEHRWTWPDKNRDQAQHECNQTRSRRRCQHQQRARESGPPRVGAKAPRPKQRRERKNDQRNHRGETVNGSTDGRRSVPLAGWVSREDRPEQCTDAPDAQTPIAPKAGRSSWLACQRDRQRQRTKAKGEQTESEQPSLRTMHVVTHGLIERVELRLEPMQRYHRHDETGDS